MTSNLNLCGKRFRKEKQYAVLGEVYSA